MDEMISPLMKGKILILDCDFVAISRERDQLSTFQHLSSCFSNLDWEGWLLLTLDEGI